MSTPGTKPSVSKWQALLLLLVLAVVVYANSLRGSYHLDDHYNIRENPFVHDLGQIGRYFVDSATTSSLPENAPYRPLSTAAFALLWAVDDGATWPFHVCKTLMHVLVAWLSFLIATELLGRARSAPAEVGGVRLVRWDGERVAFDDAAVAFLGAALFVVHPCLSEAVNYISALTSVQSALLYMGAFWCFLRRRWLPMVALYGLSMLTKEEGVTLPLTIAAYVMVFAPRDVRGHAVPLAASSAALAAYLGLRAWLGSKTVAFGAVSPGVYLFTQMRAWVYYLYKIFTPWGYSVEHRDFGFSETFFDPKVAGSAALLAALTALALWAARRARLRGRASYAAFAWAWFSLCLLPSSSIFPLYEPVFEHRYYLSLTLLFPALVLGAARFVEATPARRHPLATSLVLLALLAVLGSLTMRENIVWRRELSLWSDVVEQDPLNGRALNNLAVAYQNKGDLTTALALFQRAEQVAPGYKYALIGQLACLRLLGRVEEARSVLGRLTTASDGTDTAVVHHFHAQFLLEVDANPAEAVPVLARCAEVSGGKFLPCIRLEIETLRQMRMAERLKETGERIARFYPEDRDLAFRYGLALIELGELDAAKALFERTLARDGDPQSLQNLAWIARQQGDVAAARRYWERKLELLPGDEAAWAGLQSL